MKQRQKNQNLNANQLSKMYAMENANQGRLETIQDDDLDDFGDDFDFDFDQAGDLHVEVRDEDLNEDLYKYDQK